MSWRYYSYWNLIRKDAGFDCVDNLACYRRYTSFNRTGTIQWTVQYGLVPVAEVAQDVFIRGDALAGSRTGDGALSPALYDFIEHAGGRYYYELHGTGTSLNNLFRVQVAEKVEVETWTSNNFPYRITRRHFYYDSLNPGLNTETNPATYDSVNQIVTVNSAVIINDIQNNIRTQFEEDFPGNAFNLDTGFTFSETVNISPGGHNDSFDPITAPLFKIPFI